MKTYAPSLTECIAVAKPMPLVPPVTSAIFPSSLPKFDSLALGRRLMSGSDPGYERSPKTQAPKTVKIAQFGNVSLDAGNVTANHCHGLVELLFPRSS